jgi:hypothetical protein
MMSAFIRQRVYEMFDWNRNGKIDAGDHAFTAFLIDEMDKTTGGCGCCGTTVAMFLIAVLLPVIVVFVAH